MQHERMHWLVSEILFPLTGGLLASAGALELARVWWAQQNSRPDIVRRSGALGAFFLVAALHQLWIAASISGGSAWMVTHPILAALLVVASLLLLLYALACRAFVGAAWWAVPTAVAAFVVTYAWLLD